MTPDEQGDRPESVLSRPQVLGILIGVIFALSLSLNVIPTWLRQILLVALVVVLLLISISFIAEKATNKKVRYAAVIVAIVVITSGGVWGWHWITETPTPTPYMTSAIKITNPANGDKINGVNVTVRGTTQINVTNQSMWVLVYPRAAPNRFYPQQPVTTEGSGRWACNVFLGTSDSNTVGNYDVYAVIVDSASATNFQNYLDNSNQQLSWPGVSSQPGIISYDHISLTRVQ
jgi:hypothetical protein